MMMLDDVACSMGRETWGDSGSDHPKKPSAYPRESYHGEREISSCAQGPSLSICWTGNTTDIYTVGVKTRFHRFFHTRR